MTKKDKYEIKKFKIDNHNVTTCLFGQFDNNFELVVYYDYNNNYDSTSLFYSLNNKKFLYGYDKILTTRQKKLLENKILKLYKSYI